MELRFTEEFFDSFDRITSPSYRAWRWVVEHTPWRLLRQLWQRGTRGYADEDLWDLRQHLGKVIGNSLKGFRAMQRMGYPGYPGIESPEQWNKILDEMIEGVDEMTNWDDIMAEIGDRHHNKATGAPHTFMGITHGNDWGNEQEKQDYLDEYNLRQDEALRKARLFIEHFWCLWD